MSDIEVQKLEQAYKRLGWTTYLLTSGQYSDYGVNGLVRGPAGITGEQFDERPPDPLASCARSAPRTSARRS